MKKLLVLFISIFILFQTAYAVEFPEIDSKVAEIYDMTDEKILYEIEATNKVPIASLTKIATVITAIEKIDDVNEKVTLTWDILNTVDPDSSIAGLKGGDVVTYKDLLYASILPSGADATHAIAILKFESIDSFVEEMNNLVQRIGLSNTHFANVTGLNDPNHFSTANDMRMLLEFALQNPLFREIYTTKEYTLSNGLEVKSTLYNYNISKDDANKILGSKTGYTKEAGYCLSSLSNINGHDIITITLNAKKDGQKYYNIIDTIKLIDFMNENYDNQVIIDKGVLVAAVQVNLSDIDYYHVLTDSEVVMFLPNDYDKTKASLSYDGIDELDFRNKKGDKIGEISCFYDNELIATEDVFLNVDISLNFAKVFEKYFFVFVIIAIVIVLIIVAYFVRRHS